MRRFDVSAFLNGFHRGVVMGSLLAVGAVMIFVGVKFLAFLAQKA